MSCPILIKSNTIELTVHTSCYCGLRLTLCEINKAKDYSFPLLAKIYHKKVKCCELCVCLKNCKMGLLRQCFWAEVKFLTQK